MKTINDKVLCDALEVAWKCADDEDTGQWWSAVMAEIDGMQSLLIYSDASQEVQEDSMLLWMVAFERKYMGEE